MHWKKLSHIEINDRVEAAIKQNINIIAIRPEFISSQLAKKYHLIPDNSEGGEKW